VKNIGVVVASDLGGHRCSFLSTSRKSVNIQEAYAGFDGCRAVSKLNQCFSAIDDIEGVGL